MNKTELIAAVAENAGLTKKDVEKAVAALLETVKGEVAKKAEIAGVPMDVIKMQDYGMMRGDKVLAAAENLMN